MDRDMDIDIERYGHRHEHRHEYGCGHTDIDVEIVIDTDIDIDMDRHHGAVIKPLCGHVTSFYNSTKTEFLNQSTADTWGQICCGRLPCLQ